jgi:hypothetical protein
VSPTDEYFIDDFVNAVVTGSNNYFISGLSNAPKNEAEAFIIDNQDRLKFIDTDLVVLASYK